MNVFVGRHATTIASLGTIIDSSKPLQNKHHRLASAMYNKHQLANICAVIWWINTRCQFAVFVPQKR